MDTIDQAILRALTKDGRASIPELARDLHISRANAYARVQRLVDSHALDRFTIDVDPAALGLRVAAYVGLKVVNHHWQSIFDELSTIDGVDHVALCTGEVDVMVLLRASDVSTLRDLVLEQISRIEGVLSTHTTLILEERRFGVVPAEE
ncbi:Lrp/AsnC family transcriptional regulator [Nocardioides sp. GXZ039]|uniref:Lrp/AsnC family transcriptional regulator n=1 Tax=Nocardioides sp. GXZ039 TaxID=3136018 RepID=UPI0030F3F696